MKRLIKSKWYATEKFLDKTYECFTNPTFDEVNDLRKNIESLRAVLLEDGTLYIWDANLVHIQALHLFKIPNGIHLIVESNKLEIYINDFDKNSLSQAFKNAISLYNLIDKNIPIYFYGGNIYKEFKTIDDILNYKPKNKFKFW